MMEIPPTTALAFVAIIWLIDGYLMWRRRAFILKRFIEKEDWEAAKRALTYWSDE